MSYKTIHIRITEAESRAFKSRCAEIKVPMSDVTAGLVREFLASGRDRVRTDVGGKIIGFKRSKANDTQ